MGLEWNKHYRLIDNGTKWSLQYMQPISEGQSAGSEEAVNRIMNS
jgi:hypothetical protein